MLCPESGESCLIFNWHNSRAASDISFFTRVSTKDEEKLEKTGETTLLQLLLVTRNMVMKAI